MVTTAPPGTAAVEATPTPPTEQPLARIRRAMWERRVLILLLVLIVLAALTGLLGVHARTVAASGKGYDLSVRYAATARPGISVPLEVQVQHAGGFSGPITLAVSRSYLDALQVGSTIPEPTQSTSDGDAVLLTFDAPSGSTFDVAWQVEIDPATNAGRYRGAVAVMDSGDQAVAARFRTWVLP
jgi:hypothetical protein